MKKKLLIQRKGNAVNASQYSKLLFATVNILNK